MTKHNTCVADGVRGETAYNLSQISLLGVDRVRTGGGRVGQNNRFEISISRGYYFKSENVQNKTVFFIDVPTDVNSNTSIIGKLHFHDVSV